MTQPQAAAPEPVELTFVRPFLSIQSLPNIKLPRFTVLTGLNGSGKTHLLRAIAEGHVGTNLTKEPKSDARYFTFNDLVPNDAKEFHSQALYNERDAIMRHSDEALNELRPKIAEWMYRFGVRCAPGSDSHPLRLARDELGAFLRDPSQAEHAWRELNTFQSHVIAKIQQHIGNNETLKRLFRDLHGRLGGKLAAVTLADFEGRAVTWGEVNIFAQSLSQLFMAYFETYRQNELRRLNSPGLRGPAALSHEEFTRQHGSPPWEAVNDILEAARVDFRVSYPVDPTTQRFRPRLHKLSTGVEVAFSELSSGERVLMSFALCLYYSHETRQLVIRPRLLLLDEIDAPLHPSMCRQVINAIQKSIVGDQGVAVILATHSPTTIAVAPEGAVYVMQASPCDVMPVGRERAIGVLTSEIPTLSLDFTGRRQVVVESDRDAHRYQLLFQALRSNLGAERSLQFIGVNRTDEAGDRGGGVTHVRKIVRAMADAGNRSVFGLIDWDGANQGEDRIEVLAANRRYAIENCLLDPLLVAVLAVRLDRGSASRLGLSADATYFALPGLDPAAVQEVIHRVEGLVLQVGAELGPRIAVEYVSGLRATVAEAYLRQNGHALEDAVKAAVPQFRRYQRPGDLLLAMVDPVCVELPGLVPVEIRSAFVKLLT